MDYVVLVSSIILGVLTFFGLGLSDSKRVKVLNTFTGAYLFTLVVLHLLPDLYQSEAGTLVRPLVIGGFILLGFFLQIGLDVISMGIEHGHAHKVHGQKAYNILVGLCIHAFVESLALGEAQGHGHSESSRHFLLISVVVHNYPITIALLGMLLQSGMSRNNAVVCLVFFGLMAPIGMFISTHSGLAEYSRYLMALVIGIFMHISTTILFESEDHHRFPAVKLFAVIVGLSLGIASVLFES